jgi:hypothetical protein
MGETHIAFLDFVSDHPHLDSCVVNTDWGVGMVWNPGHELPRRSGMIPERVDLGRLDYRDWNVFSANRKKMLRLISVKKFFRVFAGLRVPPHPASANR